MKVRPFILLLTILSIAPVASADKWVLPKVETYRQGDYEFRTDPAGGTERTAVGSLSRLGGQGAKVLLWKRDLVNVPHKVRIIQQGKYVLTIDTYANLGYGHALVVYGEKGKLLVDLKMEDFLSKQEITKHVYQTESSRHWYSDKHKFVFADKEVAVELSWGKKFAVSLETGKILPQKK